MPKADGALAGCGTALVTPFDANGELDEAALRTFVDWQIEEGVHFVVPCGSTGEAATMTLEEHRRVVEITIQQVNDRVPVVAGAGSNEHPEGDCVIQGNAKASAQLICCTRRRCTDKPPQRGDRRALRAQLPTLSICRL